MDVRTIAINGREKGEEARNEGDLIQAVVIIARAYRNYHLSRAAYLAPTGRNCNYTTTGWHVF